MPESKDCLHCLTRGEILVDYRDYSKGFKTCPVCNGSGQNETADERERRVNRSPSHWERAASADERTFGL